MNVYVAELSLSCRVNEDNPESTLQLFDTRWTPALARRWSRLVFEDKGSDVFRETLDAMVLSELGPQIISDLEHDGFTLSSIRPTFGGGIWKIGQGGIHQFFGNILAFVEESAEPKPWRIPDPSGYGEVSIAANWYKTSVIEVPNAPRLSVPRDTATDRRKTVITLPSFDSERELALSMS